MRRLALVFGLIVGTILIGHTAFWLAENIFVKNDLEANLLQIRYIKQSKFSSNWNPYISLPVWQDPLLGILNPNWSVPLLTLPAQSGVKVAYFVSLLMCGWGTYFLARSLRVGWPVAVMLTMTFIVSGYPLGRIMAGHVEKVLSLAFMPWILLLLLGNRSPQITGLFIAMTLWSGDVYAYTYSLIIAGVLLRFREIFWRLGFGLFRIIPILQLTPYLYKPVEPLAGTQNLFSIFYHSFWPIKQFWGGLMAWVPSSFAWWEKAAYVGILPSFFIFHSFKKSKLNLIIWVLIILAILGFRTDLFRYFHVPTRVFGYLSLVVILAAGMVVKNKYLWVLNFVFCMSLTWFAYTNRQMPKIELEIGDIPAGSMIAFDQLSNPIHVLEAQERGIRMVATNYGVMLKGGNAEKWLKFWLTGKQYDGTIPDYIVYPKYDK